jgi:hypothetical protein
LAIASLRGKTVLAFQIPFLDAVIGNEMIFMKTSQREEVEKSSS